MTDDPAPSDTRRLRLVVTGVVQGVGFRPFVYRLATTLGLVGWVRNDPSGVLIEAQADAERLTTFRQRLLREAPPLSRIESCEVEWIPPVGDRGFEIRETTRSDRPTALVTPDTATCADCLRELFDPDDRRYRYPFINCTNCGPRFTIVTGIPYDRPYTTMAAFEMCELCRAEYEDPLDRRFHAQPNACPVCGPAVRLLGENESPPGRGDPISRAARALREGAIVAVKGLGGYHLACLAADERAVGALRGRKHREDKPFAVMVPDLAAAERLARVDALERRLLEGRERPIVLLRRTRDAHVAAAVAPGHRDLGLMLAYSPVHHLLLADVGEPLVMTSGNVSDEPIAYRDDEALDRLSEIADLFLVNDRPIHTRTDDSVVRAVTIAGERRPLMLRRSRGFVPAPVPLPEPAPHPVLATGAHLKNTFTLAAGRRAWVGHHIGDLENYATLRSFESGIEHFETLFDVEPEAVAHDQHPDYLSTRYASNRADADGLTATGIQHHHAHLAACLAEFGHEGPAIGAIFDGTGYGTDGTVWGGEVLVGDLRGFERVGHLWPVRLPGGEAAVRQPWRMACAWLCELEEGTPEIPAWLEGEIDPVAWRAVEKLARSGLGSPATTSAGRLFDAVSALCGIRLDVSYEGQAAIELEMAASGEAEADTGYSFPLIRAPDGPFVIDAREAIRAVVRDMGEGESPGRIAARFHAGLADATAAVCAAEADRRGIAAVGLSGGVFQNVLLLERTAARLAEAGVRPLIPRVLPPNDGGISYGQAAIAAARAAGSTGADRT